MQTSAQTPHPGVAIEPGRNGLTRAVLTHPSGASAEVYLHGGHVTAWRGPGGKDLLFLSRQSLFERGRAIRGGIPVIFPQFGPGELPQHGFARVSEWALLREDTGIDPVDDALWALLSGDAEAPHGPEQGDVYAALGLHDSPSTMAEWPHPFRLDLGILLREHSLALSLQIENTGDTALVFQVALHTYFGVADIAQTALLGLAGVPYLDSLRGGLREVEARDAIRFEGETDRVYVNAPDRLRLADEAGRRTVHIEKTGLPDVVVWNPWIAKSQRMEDFGDEEYRSMVCVETGAIAEPIALAPGDQWSAATTFRIG